MEPEEPKSATPATETKGHGKRGRPPKFDAARAERILGHLRGGHFLETAAALESVSPKTVRAWLAEGGRAGAPKRFADFLDAVRKARAESEGDMLGEMERRAKNANDGAGDWKERAWRLERKDPRKWGPKLLVEFRNMLGEFLDHLEATLDDETFERVAAAAASFDGEENGASHADADE